MNKHLEKYYAAYKAMKEAAIKTIKEYGRTLEVIEECKNKLIKEKGCKSVDEIEWDELNDYIHGNTYSCFLIGKHEQIHLVNVVMVRYNAETKQVEAFLESNEGDVAEWFPVSWISGDEDAVYQTILDFLADDQ